MHLRGSFLIAASTLDNRLKWCEAHSSNQMADAYSMSLVHARDTASKLEKADANLCPSFMPHAGGDIRAI